MEPTVVSHGPRVRCPGAKGVAFEHGFAERPVVTLALSMVLGLALPSQPSLASEVPAPFTPLATRTIPNPQGAGDPVIEVSPWGRTYRFARGPLPANIVSQGTELLVGAPRWSIDTGKASVVPSWSLAELESKSARQVTLKSAAQVGTVELRARTLIEYDGMIRVDLEIKAASGDAFTLKALSYEVALRPEVALWFNHHVPYDYLTINIDKQKLLTSIGRFPDGLQSFDYAPTFFLGNYDVGIEWWADENLGWKSAQGRSPIELQRSGNEAILRIVPISAPLDVSSSWEHRFALFPAPMRPAPSRWRSNRFTSPSGARLFERSGFTYYWIAFPPHFIPKYHGLPATSQDATQASLRTSVRRDDVRYIPYGKLMAAPSYHPETLAHLDTWPANRRLFVGAPPSEADFMKRSTTWKQGEPYSYNVCAGRVDYFAWMLSENLKTLRDEHLDGIYFDYGSISSICETDPRLKGRPGEQAWHYFELRDFYQQLYERVKEVNPDALITIHTNGQPRALAAWVDYHFIGEALNALFRGGHNWEEVEKRPELYDSDYFRLPTLFLIAQTMPPIGGVTSVIPQLNRTGLKMDPAKLVAFQRGFLSQLLVNDTHFWFCNLDHPALVKTIAALDRFGKLDEAEFEPWWRPQASLRHDSELKVSVYRRSDALLAVVANWTEAPQQAELRLDSRDIAASRFTGWLDLEEQRPRFLPFREIVDNQISVQVPPHDFRLIMVR